MNPRRQHVIATMALVGGGIGSIAGLIQTVAGTRIPEWTGDKSSPVALGLLTVVLSAISIVCALRLRSSSPLTPGRRAAALTGLLVPGGLCFSTVGALWYVPGALLLAAGVALAAADLVRTREVLAANWLRVLVSALGTFELLMAVSAGPVMTIAAGVIGGLALMTAPWISAVRPRIALLIIGTLPFAALTWWSLASPLLAALALAVGLTLRRRVSRPPVPQTSSDIERGRSGDSDDLAGASLITAGRGTS